MPLPFTLTLIAVIVALITARFFVPAGVRQPRLRPFTVLDFALVILGTAGLVLHCGAMFYRSIISAIPGSDSYVHTVNHLGPGSVILYLVPAALLLLGLRRQQPLAVLLLGLALAAVGVTMYDHGPLTAHLTAIFTGGVLLAGTLALLVQRPHCLRQTHPERA